MRFCGNCGARLADAPAVETNAPVATPPAPEVGALMGADLMERFRRAGLEAAGQRRNVTILFVDISGYTQLSRRLGDEELYEFIRQYIDRLANDVYKYDGMVDKFTGDGLMALFGAPIAHENNAELALRAALDMHADVAELSQQLKERLGGELHVHIGLNSGSVIVGGVGSDLMMNYTAIGDTVNLAQRLEAGAQPGVTLVSASVYQVTHMLFEYESVPDLIPKGMTEPVPCYRLVKPKERPGSVRGVEGLRAPMIGRDAELRQLMQAIGALATYQQGQFILIVGEAGLGKSRLIGELKSRTIPVSVIILEGQSLTYRRAASYWIFQDLLRNYLHVTPETPTSVISERLRRNVSNALEQRISEVLPYLEHLLSLPPSDPAASRRIEYLDAGQLRQQIFLAVRSLLIAEAHRRPLILVLEDLHWADDASLDLLQFLLDSIRQVPLLILGITRPFDGGKMGEIAAWSQKHLADSFSIIPLQGLTHQQSLQMLTRLLTVAELPAVLREQIVQRASGVPFYLEEILRMLIDAGLLHRQNGSWQLAEGADIASLGVPDSLQSLILARFDRLEPAQRRMLQVACVIGRQFSLPVLRMILNPVPDAEFAASLNRLIERDFVRTQPDAPETEFIFRHVIVSDAIYSTLLKRDRTDLHGLVGQAIETIYADRLDGQVEVLARHFAWSVHKDRALHYLILAGQKAARVYLNDPARQQFEDALNLLPQVSHSPSQALQVYMGLGDVLLLTGEYVTARAHYQSALQLLLGLDPDRYLGEKTALQRKVATTHERQGDYEGALRYLALAEQSLINASQPMPIEQAQIFNDIGWIQFKHGNFDEAEKSLIDALALAVGANRPDVTASIYNRLGGVFFQKDQLDQASYYVQKSLALREEIGDILAVARSYNNLGLLGWKSGHWDDAIAGFTRCLELNSNLGDVEGAIELHGNLGLLYNDRGNIAEAQQHFEDSLTLAQQIGHRHNEGLMNHYYSRLFISVEDWHRALEYANRSLVILKEVEDLDNLVDVYVNLGQAHLGLGNTEMAQHWGDEALKLFCQLEGSKAPAQAENRGRALRLLGEVAQINEDFERAASSLQESAEIFQITGNQLEQGRASLALARLAAHQGNAERSHQHLEEARKIFQSLGANQDLQQVAHLAALLETR